MLPPLVLSLVLVVRRKRLLPPTAEVLRNPSYPSLVLLPLVLSHLIRSHTLEVWLLMLLVPSHIILPPAWVAVSEHGEEAILRRTVLHAASRRSAKLRGQLNISIEML